MMRPRSYTALAIATLLGLPAACTNVQGPLGGDGEDDTDDGGGGGDPPPPPPEPPEVDEYRRGSLAPDYKLTPSGELTRFSRDGVAFQNSSFTSPETVVSAAQKLDEIGAQIAAERGIPELDLIPRADDRQRAVQIPFRGNPSDVDLLEVDGEKKAYVPLGGDVMTPGNEVAVLSLEDGSVTRVRVGIRPRRVVAHPSGLVFVCNQYSNYISIIDARTDTLLRDSDGLVEIATHYYCSDLLFRQPNPSDQDSDRLDLYVANEWRASVIKYALEIVRDPLNDRPTDVEVVEPSDPQPENQPAAEIFGVGAKPYRISLSESQRFLYVASNRGGELARVDLADGSVAERLFLNAPAVDVVNIGDSVFVSTTMPDRGLLADDEPVKPDQVTAGPVSLTGLDGEEHVAHPGSQFDSTRSYNFEDVRNGMFQLDYLLNGSSRVYFTDDNAGEPSFSEQQKVLAGALPGDVVRDAAGSRIFVTLEGSDLVQELDVSGGSFKLQASGAGTFSTAIRPSALALDAEAGELLVAAWGGEVLQVFDLETRALKEEFDLGYASPAYPATDVERGERFYYDATWSNDGRKSCATCHLDELITDGLAYSNGAQAPTALHQVKPNYDLLTTDSYFWNGSFSNGSYESLAFAAQTRTNCEVILFGFTEGPSSDPAGRVGDPNNRFTDGNDDACRPIVGDGPLPDNFDQISQVIAAQKQVANGIIQDETGLSKEELAAVIDFYSVAELRLPPNPLQHLYRERELTASELQKLDRGRELFTSAGCAGCHDPANPRHPFTDGQNHGSGADWTQRFVNTYINDPRVTEEIGSLPEAMLQGMTASEPDPEINVHVDPIDYFRPFCFTGDSCLVFDDPLAVVGTEAETERLQLLIDINLADPNRGFIPGNVRGQPAMNTPSLRGLWWRTTRLLHHGHARSVAEAILAPGHPALGEEEAGLAIDALGQIDVHGTTSELSPEDVEALILYASSIE